MLEPMTVHVEVWPLAADHFGIWLLSGDDALRSGPVLADNEPHAELEYVLDKHNMLDTTALVHSTSWRVDGPAVVLTYVAIVKTADLVRSQWPKSLPISTALPNEVGKPIPNEPTDAPAPRYIDVLMHALRHLRFLLDTDSTNAAAMDDSWRLHLNSLQPALAGMYVHDNG